MSIVLHQHDTPAPPPVIEGEKSTLSHALKRLLWQTGRTLKVQFVNGTPLQKQFVRLHAVEWTRYANLRFQFDAGEDAQIQIRFYDGTGGHSRIGSSSLNGQQNGEPSMSLGIPRIPIANPFESLGANVPWPPGGLPGSAQVRRARRTVLHEFGHALGFIHEHQAPEAPFKWRKDVMRRHWLGVQSGYGRRTLTAEQEQAVLARRARNYFKRAKAGDVVPASGFNPQSIMIYRIYPWWTEDGASSNETLELSEGDKEAARRLYPRNQE